MSYSVSTNGCCNVGRHRSSLNNPALADEQALQVFCDQTPQKIVRNRDHLAHHPVLGGSGFRQFTSTWVCKNLACKAILSSDDVFCRRCSCCICHRFDDNKDPSLWLFCSSETNDKDSCGSSCHIDCALKHAKVGCVTLGHDLRVDGSYCCALCGKVSGILGSCRRQLAIAKDCRRVDILCYRIYLSYKLLLGTSRLNELFQIIENAKYKLENEVGPLDGDSMQLARGIVSRLPGGNDVQKLCSLAIEKADDILASNSSQNGGDSLPAACRFKFEGITSTSLVIILKQTSSVASDIIKGYKFWFWKSRDEQQHTQPLNLMKDQRKLVLSNLEPCTEYTFRVISFTDGGNLGHSEAKCFTGSKDTLFTLLKKNRGVEGCSSRVGRRKDKNATVRTSGFKIRNIGKVLRQAWSKEGYFEGYCEEMEDDPSIGGRTSASQTRKDTRAVSRRLDLNEIFVPDLNVEPSLDCPSDENRPTLKESNGVRRSNDSGCSKNYTSDHVQHRGATEAQSNGRKHSDDSPDSMRLNEDFEYSVKVIRWLECSGLIRSSFRMKFLTWFSFRSSEKEQKVAVAYMRTLIDEPSILAGQLIDSFEEMVSCKKPRDSVCGELQH